MRYIKQSTKGETEARIEALAKSKEKRSPFERENYTINVMRRAWCLIHCSQLMQPIPVICDYSDIARVAHTSMSEKKSGVTRKR